MMFKINLEEKIIDQKQRSINNLIKQKDVQELLLNNVQNILDNNIKEDLDLLRKSGFSRAIQNASEKEEELRITNTILEDLTNPRIFTEGEIKRIAINYGLRFLPNHHYKGILPNNLAVLIREAEELQKGKFTPKVYDHSIDSYFILAPKESFDLQARPKDPLLFLKLANDTYYLVCKWGNDLSSLRYIQNLVNRTWIMRAITILFVTQSILMWCTKDVSGSGANIEEWMLISGLMLVVSVGFTSILAIFGTYFNCNDAVWNSKFKN